MKNSVENKIAIVGLGYVGLILAFEFGKKYDPVGRDLLPERVKPCDKERTITKIVKVGLRLLEMLIATYLSARNGKRVSLALDY